MITLRTTALPTQQEIETFSKFIEAHGIRNDESNLNIFADFMERWNVEISDESLSVAMAKLQEAGRLNFYSQAEKKYRIAAAAEPDRAAQLAHWFENFNKTLIKTGDEGWENQSALLAELRGREINSPNIYDAIGRISSTRGGLHYTPVERKIDPRQHQDSGSFAPKMTDRSVVGGRKNHAFKEPQQEAPKADTPDASGWQEMCQKMLGVGPHSRQAEMLRIYTSPGKTYREIYSEMAKLKNSFDKVGRI
jgi:hypothetical protein